MKFYVAAYVGETEQVQTLYRLIRERGHEITVDWTDLQTDMSDDDKEAIADRDIAGIETCDVFVLLAGQSEGRGKYVELGAAIMSNIRIGRPAVYVIGQSFHHSVF